jgi:hypothetical protein
VVRVDRQGERRVQSRIRIRHVSQSVSEDGVSEISMYYCFGVIRARQIPLSTNAFVILLKHSKSIPSSDESFKDCLQFCAKVSSTNIPALYESVISRITIDSYGSRRIDVSLIIGFH